MNCRALSKFLLPMTDAEASAFGVLDWLSRQEALPESIRDYLFAEAEVVLATLRPENEWVPLCGCRDVKRDRAALDVHLARRRAAVNHMEQRNGD